MFSIFIMNMEECLKYLYIRRKIKTPKTKVKKFAKTEIFTMG